MRYAFIAAHATARRLTTTCRVRARTPLLALGLGAMIACVDATSGPERNPRPTLIRMIPLGVYYETPDRTILARGRDFHSSSVVRVNGNDRATTFVNDSTVEFVLTETDVAAVRTLQVTVSTPPPGGGLSAQRGLSVEIPTPGITSITPNWAFTGDPAPEITITGGGFLTGSIVHVQGQYPPVTYVSTGELRVTIPASFMLTAQGLGIMVRQPGLVYSNGVGFQIVNPLPTLSAVSVDSLVRGTGPVTVTLTGTRFVAATRARVNGSERTTTRISDTELRAVVGFADLSAHGSIAVTVHNPAPMGGTSEPIAVPVVRPPPSIRLLSPGSAQAASGSLTLSVAGNDFEPDVVIDWNGEALPTTFVSPTAVTVAVDAALLANPGSASLRARNPSRTMESAPVGFPILPASPTVETPVVVELVNAFVVGDPSGSVAYASIPDSASVHAGSVVKLDALTGTVLGVVPIGSDPKRMAISDDGQYLYVARAAAPSLARVRLSDLTVDAILPTANAEIVASERVYDLVVLPGRPLEPVALTATSGGGSPMIVRWVDTERLPDRPAINGALALGPTADAVYVFQNFTTGFALFRVFVEPSGLRLGPWSGPWEGSFERRIESSGDLIVFTDGVAVRMWELSGVGSFPAAGAVRPDLPNGRVHFVVGTDLRTFTATSFGVIGTASEPALSGLKTLSRFGANGLVAGGGARIVLLRGSLIGE